MNFLQETSDILKKNSKTWANIIEIQDGIDPDFDISTDDFIKKADFTYNPYSKTSYIIPTLVIIGDNWCLVRKKEKDRYGEMWGWEFNKIENQNSYLNIPDEKVEESDE